MLCVLYGYYIVLSGSSVQVCGWTFKETIIQMIAAEQFFVFYCYLYCTRWFQLLSLWNKLQGTIIYIKATKQHLPAVLCVMPYKMVVTFDSAHQTSRIEKFKEKLPSNVLRLMAYFTVQYTSSFQVCGSNSKVRSIKYKLLREVLYSGIV